MATSHKGFALKRLHLLKAPAERDASGKLTKAPEITVVSANTIFEAKSKKLLDEFVDRGDARLPSKGELAESAPDAPPTEPPPAG